MSVKVVDDMYREGTCHPMQLLTVQHEKDVSHYLFLNGENQLVVAYLFNDFHEEPEQLFDVQFNPGDVYSLQEVIENLFDDEADDVLINLISVGILDPQHQPLGISPAAYSVCM